MILLLTVLTFYLAHRERLALAGAAAFLATLTRAQSAVLVVPLLIYVWRRFGSQWWRNRNVLWSVLAAPATVLAYQAYLIAAGFTHVDEVYRNLWQSVPAVPGYEL
jgi:hypothetical protein